LRSSEHRHGIVPQPAGNVIEALAIPSTGEAAGKSELARGMRDVAITRARKRNGLHRAKQLRDVIEVASRPSDGKNRGSTQKKIGAQARMTYEEKSCVADRIAQRFHETGFQCKLRWFGLPSQCR
jgi:hypothetical protein